MPATPDPDLALRAAKTVADVYSQAVADLLQVIARRLARGIDQPGWQERKLLELARLRDESLAVVERLQVLGTEAATEAITDAWTAGIRDAIRDMPDTAGLTATFGATDTAAVEALVAETVGVLDATHGQILRSIEDVYRRVIAETSAPGVVTGTMTRRQAAQRALDRFADTGVTGFVDRAGRRWEIESYTEMATRTSAGRAQVAGALDRFGAAGRDLVIVSDAPQECPLCRPWEGKILSISGNTVGQVHGGRRVVASVSTARGEGLLHANCRHALGAFVPGLTQPVRATADPEGDVARQEQRRLERGVRRWRRREAVALDDVAGRQAAARAREWQARLRQHVEANDLKRQPHRERVGASR